MTTTCRKPAFVAFVATIAVATFSTPTFAHPLHTPPQAGREGGPDRVELDDVAADERLRRIDALLFTLEPKLRKTPFDMVTRSRVAGYYLDRARMSESHGDYRLAEKHFRALSSLSPANADARLGLALALMGQHRFSESLLQAREGAEMLEDPASVTGILGDIHFALGNYVEAEWAYRKLKGDGLTLASLSRMAQIHQVRGRDAKASTLMADACAAGALLNAPARDLAWCALKQGELALEQGRVADAVSHFELSVEIAPEDSPQSRWRVAQAAMILGDPDWAVDTLEKLVADHPDAHYFAALGGTLKSLGRTEEAVGWFDKARAVYGEELASGDIGHIRQYAELLLETGTDAALALELARRDFDGVRQDLVAHVVLARALAAVDQHEAAADRIHRALQVGTRAPWLVRRAGVMFARAGRMAEAKLYLTRALENADAFSPADRAELSLVAKQVDEELARRSSEKKVAPQPAAPSASAP